MVTSHPTITSIGSPLPSGIIVMWSGTIANIPSGWVLCDGANSTPDLSSKFIKGVSGSSENPGSTGGGTTHTHTTHAIHSLHSTTAETSGAFGYPKGFAGTGTPNTHDAHNSPNHEPPYYELAYIMKT